MNRYRVVYIVCLHGVERFCEIEVLAYSKQDAENVVLEHCIEAVEVTRVYSLGFTDELTGLYYA